MLLGGLPLFAQAGITRVAVLDFDKVLSTFYQDSKALRNLEKYRENVQKEISSLQEEILNLEERKLKAEQDDDKKMALRLDQQVYDKKTYLSEYVRVQNQRLADMSKNLSTNNSLVRDVIREIELAAEAGGYSLVLKKSDPNLLWWSYEVDITDEVIKRLINR